MTTIGPTERPRGEVRPIQIVVEHRGSEEDPVHRFLRPRTVGPLMRCEPLHPAPGRWVLRADHFGQRENRPTRHHGLRRGVFDVLLTHFYPGVPPARGSSGKGNAAASTERIEYPTALNGERREKPLAEIGRQGTGMQPGHIDSHRYLASIHRPLAEASLRAYLPLFKADAPRFGVLRPDRVNQLSAWLLRYHLIKRAISPARYATDAFLPSP